MVNFYVLCSKNILI